MSDNHIHIPFKPRPAQSIILDLLRMFRFTTAVCHRRLGKTLLATYWLYQSALENRLPPNTEGAFRGYYLAPTQKQARQIVWQYMKLLGAPLAAQNLIKFSESDMTVIFAPPPVFSGQQIILAGAENAENLRGIYIDAAVFDEVASWRNAHYAYYEVLRPALSDRQGRTLNIGTPKTLDLLFDLYSMGLDPDPIFSDYTSIRLPASLTRIIPPKELAQLKRSLSPDAYAREIECDFFSEAPDVLITPADVNQAFTRTLTPSQQAYSQAQRPVFGVDPGRHTDPTVVMSRQGLILSPPLLYTHNPDSMHNAQRISKLMHTHNPQYVFVDAGKGEGIIDRLRQLGHSNIIEIHFNQTSPEPSCANMRAAMALRLKRWLQKGSIAPFPDPNHQSQFMREATNLETDPNEPDNKIRLVRKKIIMERIGGTSTNLVDASMLTLAEEDPSLMEDPEYIKSKLLHGFPVRVVAHSALRFIMSRGAVGVEITISGKLRGQRAKTQKYRGGYRVSTGQPKEDYNANAIRHVELRQGLVGVQVKIMLPYDPTGQYGPAKPLPDTVEISPAK